MIHTLKRKGKSWNKWRPPNHPQADTREVKRCYSSCLHFVRDVFGHQVTVRTPVYRHSILADPNIGIAQKNKVRTVEQLAKTKLIATDLKINSNAL